MKKASTMCVAGPSRCGKTSFIYNFLKNVSSVYSESDIPRKILYCYAKHQPLYDQMENNVPNIEFNQGLPSHSMIEDVSNGSHNMVILDDLVAQVQKSEDMLNLFILGSHHRNLSVIFMSQNMFHSGKHGRTIALNTQYLVLFKNPRDRSQIKYLARQIYPTNPLTLCEAYQDATENDAYGYLFLDLTQQSGDSLRMRTSITREQPTVVYMPL